MNEKMGSAGFTLVEVLVAMAIFSGLMLTLFSSFNAFTASSQMIEQYAERNRELGPGLDTLISDLEQTFVLHPPQFMDPDTDDVKTQEKFQFSAGQDQIEGKTFSNLSFASLNPVQFHNPPGLATGITRLAYYVYAHEDRLDLHRSDIPIFLSDEKDTPTPCADPVLFRDILGFELTFFDREGDEHDHWDSRDEDFDFGLPALLCITITLGGKTGEREIKTQVTLPIERRVEK